MVLVSQTAQTGAVIASVTSVTKLAGPYVPIVSIPANMVAGTITFLKIGVDVRDGKGFSYGDVISLIGNVAGVIAVFAVLVEAPFIVIGTASVVGVAAGLYSISDSGIFKEVLKSAAVFFRDNDLDNYLDYVCATRYEDSAQGNSEVAYGNQMLSCNWFLQPANFCLLR
jgi:hypothetical protein